MSRHSGKLFRVRTKEGGLFRARLVPATSSKKAASGKKGRVLSSGKVSMEELLKVGDYFKLGNRLMKEFSEERRTASRETSPRDLKSKSEVFSAERRGDTPRYTEGNTKREGPETGLAST